MDKKNLVDSLNSIETSLKEVLGILKKGKDTLIPKIDTKQKCEKTSLLWFEEIEPNLINFKIEKTVLSSYHEQFDELLKLSASASRVKIYLSLLPLILSNFKKELTLEVMKSSPPIKQFNQLEDILKNVSDEERQYFTEALGCANHGFFRAGVVLGWSAAIHRMHTVVEKKGFDEFNKKSKEMKSITDGRYKRFSKSFNVHNFSEFQSMVFDNDLLWVLEYWGLIDSNQRDRLGICFTMRNNAGHPGQATISPENLLSFYSDLKNYIFDNENFTLDD